MGTYLNPGNSGFEQIRRSTYVDKSKLIAQINDTICSVNSFKCVSRPRRFGKSYAAAMLCAYYDASCDSGGLFEDLNIAKDRSYKEHLNRYNVIYLDMGQIMDDCGEMGIVQFIKSRIESELSVSNFVLPRVREDSFVTVDDFASTLIEAVETTGRKFIAIIDEWDMPVREDSSCTEEYLRFLRALFKGSGTSSRIFAAAYMTGILPIKKDITQSALSNFEEYSMTDPGVFDEYVGFTEDETQHLCEANGSDFDEMRRWYDGYKVGRIGSVYNPNSVMRALTGGFKSYWNKTAAAENLLTFINLDYEGLASSIASLMAGERISVNTYMFSNDLVNFRGKDEVLTALIHLGYLTYDSESELAWIPNEEVRREFSQIVRIVDNAETARRVKESDELLGHILDMNEEAVADAIEKIHMEETSPIHYNREDSLRSVIKLAMFTYRDHYLQFEELPAGHGFADVVYLPKENGIYPAIVVELKWNETADGAIEQIKMMKYPSALSGYAGDVLLVGINYDKDAAAGERLHSCKIERFTK